MNKRVDPKFTDKSIPGYEDNETTHVQQMLLAADSLLEDYKSDSELIVFTCLDSEDFVQNIDK